MYQKLYIYTHIYTHIQRETGVMNIGKICNAHLPKTILVLSENEQRISTIARYRLVYNMTRLPGPKLYFLIQKRKSVQLWKHYSIIHRFSHVMRRPMVDLWVGTQAWTEHGALSLDPCSPCDCWFCLEHEPSLNRRAERTIGDGRLTPGIALDKTGIIELLIRLFFLE